MSLYLAIKKSSLCVANLRNSLLLGEIGASNLNFFASYLLRPDQVRGSLNFAIGTFCPRLFLRELIEVVRHAMEQRKPI